MTDVFIGVERDSDVCSAWATHADADPDCAQYDTDTAELDEAMLVASDILYNLTRRRWPGVCTDVIRPQARYRKRGPSAPPAWWPGDATAPWGWCTCNRERETGCTSVPEIELRGHPVDPDHVTVTIDGAPFTEFRVDDGRYLVRTDGDGWPCCQQLTLPATEARTWEVTYRFGTAPPAGGRRAAAALGCNLYRADHDTGAECALPERVRTLTRQGVTIAAIDPLELFADGRTGIASVDLWVAAVNKGVQSRRGAVMVPGRWRGARRPGPTS